MNYQIAAPAAQPQNAFGPEQCISDSVNFTEALPNNCTHLTQASRQNLEALIATAQKEIERGELPTGSYFVRSAEETAVFKPVVSNFEDKARVLQHMRSFVLAVNADFVLLVVKSWTLAQPTMAEYERVLNKYGSVRASPNAILSVNFCLETSRGMCVALPQVLPKWPSKRCTRLEHASWQDIQQGTGVFLSMFPARSSD